MFACLCELVFKSLHAIDTSTKRESVTKQRYEAYTVVNRIYTESYYPVWIGILDLNSLGFESFRFGIPNGPSISGLSKSKGSKVMHYSLNSNQLKCKILQTIFNSDGSLNLTLTLNADVLCTISVISNFVKHILQIVMLRFLFFSINKTFSYARTLLYLYRFWSSSNIGTVDVLQGGKVSIKCCF